MYFVIDNDTKQVESKSDNLKELLEYVETNNLNLAVSIVGSFEELFFKYTIEEMSLIYGLLNGNPPKWKTDDEATEALWNTLQEHEDEFPQFTKALGRKLIKAANKRDGKPENKTIQRSKNTTNSKTSKPRKKPVKAANKTLVLGEEPKPNINLHVIWSLVDKELGEMNFNELVEAYLFETEATEKLARRYVNKCIRLGHLEVKA